MKIIVIILIADAVISTVLNIINAILQKDIDETISDYANKLREEIHKDDSR